MELGNLDFEQMVYMGSIILKGQKVYEPTFIPDYHGIASADDVPLPHGFILKIKAQGLAP